MNTEALKPRRGKRSTMIAKDVVLRNGEIFFEVPETGVGTGPGLIKMGDGTTTYENLPYFTQNSDSNSLVIVDDRDSAEYSMSFSISSTGYPVATFTPIS